MTVDDKLDEILKRLGTIERRMTVLEEGGTTKHKKRTITVPLGEKFELNQWVLATMYGAGIDRLGNISLDILDTLKPTIKVLMRAHEKEKTMLNAVQVGKETKRARNTESTYLNRLHKLGLIEKRKKGKEARYRLTDEGKLIITKLYPKLS